ARNLWRVDIIKAAQAILNGEDIPSKFIIKEHPPLVHFLDFSLVVNHNHLFLVPNIENAIPIFMKKINGNFALYLNLKYNNKGVVFNGPYKDVVIKTQLQADTVSRYISIINSLDVFQPGWRAEGLKNSEKAFEFLRNFQFSSFPDKIGKRKSKILAPPEILGKYLTLGSDAKNYKEFTDDFLKERSNMPSSFFLE
ncbi:MAG: hypothetical protein Q7R84_00435, partial [bacterium]|nr:hypothetical protein [bacterium]